jgi:chorismate--pyruvate lyase
MSNQHPSFPVNLIGQWFSPNACQLPDVLRDWLIDPSSLTSRLKKHSDSFRVELLGQKIEACHAGEANNVIKEGEQVLVREVLLYCDDIPHVFARSLLPLSSLTGAEQVLANLGTQSLGQVLFNNPSLERQCIEISSFSANSSVAILAKSLSISIEQLLWGRRSIFMLENKPLMVAEVFLPDAVAYQNV